MFYPTFVFFSVVLILRTLEELRAFQQFGYYSMPYLRHALFQRKACPDHLFFSVGTLCMALGFETVGVVLALFSFVSQIIITKGANPKHDLVYTKRVQRLFVPLFLLFAVSMYFAIVQRHQGCWGLALVYYDFFILFNFVELWIVLANLVNRPMELMINRSYYRDAERCIAKAPFLKVAAITGSYAKTSTKNILGEMLKRDFNTLVPPSSYNTKLGLTRLVREQLLPTTQIIVAEMGAKKRGEIKETVDMLPPDVSLITAISGQHLETFGSLDTIVEEKSQVYKGLKKGGTAVVNIDDEKVASLPIREDVHVVRISTEGKADIYIEDLSVNSEGLKFKLIDARAVKEGGEAVELSITTSLLGEHNVKNILAAAAMALVLGASPRSIVLAVKKLEPTKNRLSTRVEQGTVILEDAFNSNPVGAKAALNVLSLMEANRRFIITPGMIELGEEEERLHREFGKQIAAVCDGVILVTKSRTKHIKAGLLEAGYPEEQIMTVSGMREALKQSRAMTETGDVVLIENDLPDTFEEEL